MIFICNNHVYAAYDYQYITIDSFFFLTVLLPHLLKSLWVIEKKVKTERTTVSQYNEGKHKYSVSYWRLPWWLNGKEPACQFMRHGFNPWVRKIPWRRKWHPTPVFLPEKSHGQRSLVGYSPWGRKRVRHNLVTKQQQHPVLDQTKILLICYVVFFLNLCIFLIFWLWWILVAVCRAFSSCGEQRLLFTALCKLLIAGTSLVAEHRL